MIVCKPRLPFRDLPDVWVPEFRALEVHMLDLQLALEEGGDLLALWGFEVTTASFTGNAPGVRLPARGRGPRRSQGTPHRTLR